MCNKESGQSKLFFIISNSLLHNYTRPLFITGRQAAGMLRSFSFTMFTINWKTAKLYTCIVLRFLTQTILYYINDFYL